MANPENSAKNTYDLAVSEHETGSSVELDSGSGGSTETISFDVKKSYEEVRVLVQAATGNFSVALNFDNTSIDLQSGASTDLEVTQDIFSNSTVDVVISDDSGASNTVDYDVMLV